MLYYFAKLGKKPWAKSIIPMSGFFASSLYIGSNFFGHNLIRNILTAETNDGEREKISDDLQILIKKVYSEVHSDFQKQFFESLHFKFKPPPIKWFCSSTVDPVTFGMKESSTGILIGLPQRYNFNQIDELPSNMFEIQKINFFKSSSSESKNDDNQINKMVENSDKSLEEEIKSDLDGVKVTKIDRYSEKGKIYADSLVLSENAKKFSIARELFYADNYRLFLKSGSIILSTYISVYVSRTAVQILKLNEQHLAKRLPFYCLSGFVGLVTFRIFDGVSDENYQINADRKAMSYGQDYRDGAIEYFTKIISRNKALRELCYGEKYNFDEDGNISREAIFKPYYWSYTDRLQRAKSFKLEEKQIK